MTRILSLDPGAVTGYALGEFTSSSPFALVDFGVVTNVDEFSLVVDADDVDIVVAEKFILSSGNRHTADLSGVRLEGLIEWLRPDTIWRSRSDKTQVPDTVLKDHGLWKTGKQVQWEDGRDVNDAIIHALGHVAFTMSHRPTLKAYFK